MAFSRRNSSILPRSPKDGSNVFVFFEARQAKSSGASSRGASGSVREVSSSLGDMLVAVPTFSLEGFPIMPVLEVGRLVLWRLPLGSGS